MKIRSTDEARAYGLAKYDEFAAAVVRRLETSLIEADMDPDLIDRVLEEQQALIAEDRPKFGAVLEAFLQECRPSG